MMSAQITELPSLEQLAAVKLPADLPGVATAPAPKSRRRKARLPGDTTRSAVSNGNRLFTDDGTVDMRTAAARRFRDLVAAISTDLGGDLTETQKQLVRRAASLSVWCEGVEARLAAGEVVAEIGVYTTACNSVTRMLKTLGFARAMKDTDDLVTYLRKRDALKAGA